ncbi:hypothetical protein ACSNOI_03380 [Actinomadura kijaniata]|uniref:hypothetical protein n=1 Tax=Actinomadura kijaniata TaxID=46161 RepID=UPI003F1DCDDB
MLPIKGSVIPVAADGQVSLEARLFMAVGWLDHSLWPTGTPVAGFSWMTPRVNELLTHISRTCLIDFINQVMPFYYPANADGRAGDPIHGVEGLRAHVHFGRVVLRCLGRAGRIVLAVAPADWRKAAAIALADNLHNFGKHQPEPVWLSHPHQLHPAEREPLARDHFAPNLRHGAPLSALLRRLPLLSAGPNVDYWKMWTNGAALIDHPYAIHLLWANGASHDTVLEHLLDEETGLLDEQTGRPMRVDDSRDLQYDSQVCRCGPDVHCGIRLRHRGPAKHLFLRRATEPPRNWNADTPLIGKWHQQDVDRRARLCEHHGYVLDQITVKPASG